MVVVDCLENNDETLKRETLELLFKMTNANNLEVYRQFLNLTFQKGNSIKVDALFENDS